MTTIQKVLIIGGVILIVGGLFYPWISKLPIGRLPGDIIIDKPGFKLYFPIVTMIIVSVVITVILWIIRKL